MKNTVFAALLLAGSVFLCGNFAGRVARDVVVDGVNVGGLTYAEAEQAVRENIVRAPLVLRSPAGDAEAELSFTDDAAHIVRKAKKGQSLSLTVKRHWLNAEEALFGLCRKNAREARNAELKFSAGGFEYLPEKEGLACDFQGTLNDITAALKEGRTEVTLRCRSYKPAVTVEDLRARTRKLASFYTCFDPSNEPRVHNITLAASRISGTVLNPGEEFSFNAVVGKRTEENGFRVAAVIFEGEFVPGVGGGVCQASTTLFGAALRAGLTVVESHPHSLSVGYAPPSLDAMVSETSDLRFFNPYDYPVYLLGAAEEGSVRFTFYGMPDGKQYRTESVLLARIPPPPPEEIEGEEDGVLRAEKEGIKSESYLIVYASDGSLLSRTRIRKDRYAAVQGKLSVKRQQPPEAPLELEGMSNYT